MAGKFQLGGSLIPGPCIIKVQAIASAADTDGNSGFDLVLVRDDL